LPRRRARRYDHVGRQQVVELPVELLLELDPLGPVLLDEIGAGDRMRQLGRKLQVRLRRSGRKAQSFERGPGRINKAPQRGLSIRRNIRRRNFQTLG
jgi:hypothetical protein